MKKDKIDFVMIWVDGSDQEWIKEKNKHMGIKNQAANTAKNFRDYDILKYWFRAVEKYAPWVNNVYFVTCGHKPSWLNTKHPKLKFINHKDYMPERYLPTFNSHTIELNLHRIKGLSEQFVYFNDDMMLMDYVEPEFFFENGLPKDALKEDIQVFDKTTDLSYSYYENNMLKLINSHFNKKDLIRKDFTKYFNLKYGKNLIKNILLSFWSNIPGFDCDHMPNAYLKSTFKEVWEKEPEILEKASITKFREVSDVSQFTMKLWQIYSGKFIPTSTSKLGQFFILSDENEELYKFLKNPTKKMVCINDGDHVEQFDKVKKELQEALDVRLGEKSKFEK